MAMTLIYDGLMPDDIGKRDWNKMVNAALETTGEYWHQKFRAKHFTHAGAREYGYVKRKGEELPRGSKKYRRSYTGLKLRKHGHTYPLVFSGLSRDLTRVRDVRAAGKRVRVLLYRAATLNRSAKKGRIKMSDEMTRVSVAERAVLVEILDEDLGRQMQTYRRRRKVAAAVSFFRANR